MWRSIVRFVVPSNSKNKKRRNERDRRPASHRLQMESLEKRDIPAVGIFASMVGAAPSFPAPIAVQAAPVVSAPLGFQLAPPDNVSLVGLNPQPLPPDKIGWVGLNPQPLPPDKIGLVGLNPQPLPPSKVSLVGLVPQPLRPITIGLTPLRMSLR